MDDAEMFTRARCRWPMLPRRAPQPPIIQHCRLRDVCFIADGDDDYERIRHEEMRMSAMMRERDERARSYAR